MNFQDIKNSIGSKVKSLGVMSANAFQSLVGKEFNVESKPVVMPNLKMAKGTNYDPYDRFQNDPNRKKEDIGVGAAGTPITPKMIAVSRKSLKSGEPYYPYGTIIKTPLFPGELFLVADLKKEAGASPSFDFATPGKGKTIDPRYNQSIPYEIVELGQENNDWGKADARKKADRFK